MKKTVFITGGNRGIGLALCDKFANELGYKVYMGVRNLEKAKIALEQIGNPLKVIPIAIDVEFEESIAKAYQYYLNVKEEDEQLNLFINNAGAQLDWVPNASHIKTLEMPIELLDRIFRINTFSSLLTTRYFLPSMKAGTRIVNVSSGSGNLWDANAYMDFQVGYASSKIALLMMTKKIAAAVEDKGIYVNAVCPGWCKTSMGGECAETTPEDGANSIIQACFLDVEKPPRGQFFRYGQRILVDVPPTSVYPYEQTIPIRKRRLLKLKKIIKRIKNEFKR